MHNNAHNRQHYRTHKDQYFRRNKRRKIATKRLIDAAKDRPCMDCGLSFPPYVMDFDHVRGKKAFNLAHAANRGWGENRILAEIDKCEVVCANCHRIRTHQRSRSSTDRAVAS